MYNLTHYWFFTKSNEWKDVITVVVIIQVKQVKRAISLGGISVPEARTYITFYFTKQIQVVHQLMENIATTALSPNIKHEGKTINRVLLATTKILKGANEIISKIH